MKVVMSFLINSTAIFITVLALPGVEVNGIATTLLLSLVLSLLNTFFKPVLILLSLPITILTLGLFLIVINVLIILIADYLIEGFHIQSLGWAIAFSIVLSLITSILQSALASYNPNR